MSPRPRLCCFCNEEIKWDDRSVDHIIPKSVCWELELFALLVDERNLRIAHKRCNSLRANDVSDLPISVRRKLDALRSKKMLDASEIKK